MQGNTKEIFSAERLTECVNNIILALNENDTKKTIQTCCELGFFLQNSFPGKVLDDLQKSLRKFIGMVQKVRILGSNKRKQFYRFMV